jgi:hypothetical protein
VPFAGVLESRDWPLTGLSTRGWLRIRPQEVEIGLIWASQDGIFLEPLIRAVPGSCSGDPVPHLVLWNGRLSCEDGHHRLIRAAINGQTKVLARVYISVP